MNKLRLFVENFLIYGLGGVISKLVPLIMLPVVTRMMPKTAYYGMSDLSNTVVQLGSQIAIMGMYDAVFRMFFEKEEERYKKSVCSTALIYTFFASVVISLVLVIGREVFAELVFGTSKYEILVCLSAVSVLVGATNSIVMIPTRTQNKRITYLALNTISSVVSYSVSVILLLKEHYVIALPVGALVAAITIEVAFFVLNRKWFSIRNFDKGLLKQLLKIAVPLLPNFLIYWIFNSCDRLMIARMLGNSYAGIYSVGAKLGMVSQLIYSAFAGGWQFFAFSTMKEENQVKSNSLVFEYLGIISFVAGMFMCAASYLIFRILFVGEYVSGYQVAPYLFLAPLMQMLFQVACNQFLVIKRTWPNMLILSIGAVLNIFINYYFIPIMGIEGAALATLVGYTISTVICVMVLCYMNLMTVSKRFIISTGIMVAYMAVWRLFLRENVLVGILLSIFFSVIYAKFYKKDILGILKKDRFRGIK